MANFRPATWPHPLPTVPLIGSLVRLEPLRFDHIDSLAEAGSDPHVWEFTTSRADSVPAMRQYVQKLVNDRDLGTAVPFAVRDLRLCRIVGCTRLKELDPTNRRGIIGSWYAPEVWRTGFNLEAKWLLLRYAFEVLECIRIEFHTDALNVRSRNSLDRLGAFFEGILRAHQITRDGMLRDSAMYSVLRGEWPAVSLSIRARLTR